MMIKSHKDFYSGLLFGGMGVAFAGGSFNYNIGEGARMGPGYFPLMLGVLLALMGAAIVLRSLAAGGPDGDRIGRWAWKPLACVLGANLAFGVALGGLPSLGVPALGLMAGIYILVLVASLAAETYRLPHVLILATVLAVGSYLAFIMLLKLQIPVWPSFITG
jgi:hypothetical protein